MYEDSLQRTWTVIVAEADQEVRKAVAAALWRIGCNVAQAPDGRVVRTLLRTLERVDLLLTDYHLPAVVSSIELTAAARAHHPEIKVLFIGDLASLVKERPPGCLRDLVGVVKALLEKS